MARRSKLKRSPGQQRRLERRAASRAARKPEDPRYVVCEKCWLMQEYQEAPWDGESLDLIPCEGPLGLPCPSETCITIEHYEELVA